MNTYTRTKLLTGLAAVIFLAGVFYVQGASSVFATTAFAAEEPFDMSGLLSMWSIFIELCILVSFLLYPLITYLLDPAFFLNVSSGGEAHLLTIWQVSRDIMNTIFAFMLVAAAVMTVITAKPDYLKNNAVKFVMSVILVNFSWFFPRVILDVSHVLTANIYELPSIVGTECKYRERSGAIVPCTFPTKFKFFPDADFVEASKATPGSGYTCVSDYICYVPETLDSKTNIAGGILSGLMLNHARLGELNKVLSSTPKPATKDYKTYIKQTVAQLLRAGLQLLMVVFIAIILVGMMFALLVRIPILWMTMAFMPFMFLNFVAGDIFEGKFNTMEHIFKKFLHAAFLPAVIAIPLTVGFILINTLSFTPPPSSAADLAADAGAIMPGINDLWSLLWQLITIVVMWKGFKMALSIDSTFEAATSYITGFGDNLGTIVKNAPLNLPFLPGGKTLGSLGSGIGQVAGASSRGEMFSALKQWKNPSVPESSSSTIDITLDSRTKTALQNAADKSKEASSTGLRQEDIKSIAAEIKRQTPSPDTKTEAIVNRIKTELSGLGVKPEHIKEDEIRNAVQSTPPAL